MEKVLAMGGKTEASDITEYEVQFFGVLLSGLFLSLAVRQIQEQVQSASDMTEAMTEMSASAKNVEQLSVTNREAGARTGDQISAIVTEVEKLSATEEDRDAGENIAVSDGTDNGSENTEIDGE